MNKTNATRYAHAIVQRLIGIHDEEVRKLMRTVAPYGSADYFKIDAALGRINATLAARAEGIDPAPIVSQEAEVAR